jgi:lipid II:glycine glycyltransferase (peptidoglycan interpeptide bridge formation enzyme)
VNLVELQEKDKQQYNQFVSVQPSGSFLQSWEWGQWQEKLGKQAFRFFLSDDDNNIQVSIQVIQSPLPLGRYYLYIPYGPVIKENFQFSIYNLQFLLQELKKKFPSAVFIRVEPKAILGDLHQIGKKSGNIQPGKTLVINLQQSQDELLAGMHPKTRYNIKLAQRHGVEVSADLIAVPGHGLYVKEALDLIVETADRQSFKTFPREYYQQFLDFFVNLNIKAAAQAAANNSRQSVEALAKADALQNFGGVVKIVLYKALLGRELLSAAVMVDFGKTRTYLFGGSSGRHREAMAPHSLHFTAMLDAKNAGLKFYDFWGIETAGGETPGFVKFKLGFGGQIVSYPGAWDIMLRRLWYHGYKTLRKVNRVWLRIKFLTKKPYG